jgi:FkbM family methyltransferase
MNLTAAAAAPLRASSVLNRYARAIGFYHNWWDVYHNRLKRPSDATATYRLRSGETFELGNGIFEARVLNEIWIDRAYEPTPAFVIQPGWNVIDAGAHKGIFTVRAARAGARVIALEPETSNRAALCQNLARNGCDRVEVLPAALWSQAGEAVLHYFGGDASTNFSLILGDDDGSTDTVPTVTLQSLVEQLGHVDLIKLDIEGAEVPVLRSTPPETLQRINRIVLDYYVDVPDQGESAAREIEALLTPLGFDCTIQRRGCIFYAVRS